MPASDSDLPREYQIVSDADSDRLEGKVRDEMKRGWAPVGGPFVNPFMPGRSNVFALPREHLGENFGENCFWAGLCQAMVR
jgi:hypothetical protein